MSTRIRIAIVALALVLVAEPAVAAKSPRLPTMSYERAYGVASLAASQLRLLTGGFGDAKVGTCRRLDRARWNCRISSTVRPGTPSAEHNTGYNSCTATAKARWQLYESVYTGRRYYRAVATYRGTLRCS